MSSRQSSRRTRGRIRKKKLTEEQKQIRQEVKLIKEEEAKKRKQEQIRLKLEVSYNYTKYLLLLQAKLEEEEKLAKIHVLSIQEQWRKIMRQQKAVALKQDMEILVQSHLRLSERKDQIIDRLEKNLDEMEEQYQIALRSHLINTTEIIQLHDTRLTELEDDFTKDLEDIEEEFNQERYIVLKILLSTYCHQERR
jgi:hypothetical protein